jgi:hypothetical protein
MTRLAVALLAVAAGAPACSGRSTTAPPAEHRDGGAAVITDAPAEAVDIAAGPLGLSELASFGWRTRDGQPAFRLARTAEARGDWQAVVASCTRALAADPGHLEASYLLAVGHAKLGQLDRVLAPLRRAVAGDFARWGAASLAQPALQGFLATPAGEAWRRRVELDRARYAALIARSVIVIADGELHAFAPRAPGGDAGNAGDAGDGQTGEAGRWLRLTRTPGAVIGALAIPAARRIAYVALDRRGGVRELAVGVLQLDGGTSSGAVPLGTPGPLAVAYSARPPAGVWVGSGAPRAMTWRRLDDDRRLQPLPPRTRRPAGPWLEVTAKAQVQLHARPPNVTADWDDRALASAIRIGRSRRVVAVPSPGLIDGNTAAWSPDRVQLAFVAQLDDHCTEGAVNTAAFVADAATGGTREIERAAGGIALQWLAERTLVIAGDSGVAIHRLDGGAPPIPIPGARDLLVPRDRPRCAPAENAGEAADDGEPADPPAAALPFPQPALPSPPSGVGSSDAAGSARR